MAAIFNVSTLLGVIFANVKMALPQMAFLALVSCAYKILFSLISLFQPKKSFIFSLEISLRSLFQI